MRINNVPLLKIRVFFDMFVFVPNPYLRILHCLLKHQASLLLNFLHLTTKKFVVYLKAKNIDKDFFFLIRNKADVIVQSI